MTMRALLFVSLVLLSACNELLEIRPPADQLLVLDAGSRELAPSNTDDDAGSD